MKFKKSDKIVFLDRDGVINKFPGNGKYVTKVKDFHFIPGALEAVRKLTESGYTLFVVSNQAGVGKGIFSQAKLDMITQKMFPGVRQAGGRIKHVFYCTHRSDAGCDCRKPATGSFEKAFKQLNKSLKVAQRAYFIGDTQTDIQAGRNSGCKTIFVLSGRENRNHVRKYYIKPDYIANDLLDATKIILNENSTHLRHRRRRAS